MSVASARTGATSIESRSSWLVAGTAVAIASVSFGAPFVAVVALKQIAADLGSPRQIPALAYSLSWLGAAAGGIAMGFVAERVGVKWTVILGALMIAAGLCLATAGTGVALLVGHGVFIGVLGNAGINAPLYIYVARWFDRRRGTALALMASGTSVAGAIWSPIFAYTVVRIGWRDTMLAFAAVELLLIVPTALLVLRPPPEPASAHGPIETRRRGEPVLGMRPGIVLALLMAAGFCCCVPMAMPQGHLVALCSDLGISSTVGATMLSVLLGCAFFSRQAWGLVADRIGGLRTVFVGSVCQIVAMVGFLLTQSEAGLFAISTVFGLGFSGIIPAYVLAIRELFPAAEASWRVPSILLMTGSGMAAGGWAAGAIYDAVGAYSLAFTLGIAFNLANLLLIGGLVVRERASRPVAAVPVSAD